MTRSRLVAAAAAAAVSAPTGCGGDEARGQRGAGGAGGGDSAAGASFDAAAGAAGGAAFGGSAGSAGSAGSTIDSGAGGCARVPGPDDGPRRIVVSHPFDADSMKSPAFEVIELAADGTLTAGDVRFEVTRAGGGEIAFTPDGEVGLFADDDGNVGVFRLDPTGAPEVVHAAYDGQFYASSVVVGPSGDVAYVLDTEWDNIGGGIYALAIGCDGTLSNERLVAAAKLPAALVFLPGSPDRAFVPAEEILGTSSTDDSYLLSWQTPPAILGSARAFPDGDPIVSSAAVTADGRYALVGDASFFASEPNRVAVVEIGSGGLSAVQVLTPIEDPVDVATSPYDDAAIVASGFGDALVELGYDPSSSSTPFTIRSETVSLPLPGSIVTIDRGPLRGLALVAENTGVRAVRFEKGGAITDLGATLLGSGTAAVVGAIGVTP